jgi:hypothetical protein
MHDAIGNYEFITYRMPRDWQERDEWRRIS